jgi:hypothetical protein
MVFRSFPVGAQPPPRVEPQSLVQVAREYLQLVVPAVDRNPKLKEVPGAALVGFPTWFWVTDPVAVGAPTGRRTIRVDGRWRVGSGRGHHHRPAGDLTCRIRHVYSRTGHPGLETRQRESGSARPRL